MLLRLILEISEIKCKISKNVLSSYFDITGFSQKQMKWKILGKILLVNDYVKINTLLYFVSKAVVHNKCFEIILKTHTDLWSSPFRATLQAAGLFIF